MTDELRRFVLHEGLDDWVSYEQLRGQQPDSTEEERLRVVRELAEEGLVEVGDLSEGSFHAWPGDVDGWIARIRQVLSGGDTVLTIWLCNTEAGDAAARA